MLDGGHETPLKNKRISEKNKNITIPVSLCGRNTDMVIEKNTTANR